VHNHAAACLHVCVRACGTACVGHVSNSKEGEELLSSLSQYRRDKKKKDVVFFFHQGLFSLPLLSRIGKPVDEILPEVDLSLVFFFFLMESQLVYGIINGFTGTVLRKYCKW
jgi:hypothetical protein